MQPVLVSLLFSVTVLWAASVSASNSQHHFVPDNVLRAQLAQRKSDLNALHIGHGTSDYGLKVGESFVLSSNAHAGLRRHGQLHSERIATANKLAYRAYFEHSPLIRLLETGLTDAAREVQQALYLKQGYVRAPALLRVDMLDPTTYVECNVPGGGLGLMHLIEQFATPDRRVGKGLARAWAHTVRALTQRERPRIALPIYNNKTRAQTFKFAEALHDLGLTIRIYTNKLPSPEQIDLVIRKNLNNMATLAGWPETWAAYLERQIEMDPPPTSIYDNKVADLMPYLQETREAFSDEIRQYGVPARLVKAGLHLETTGGGGVVPIEQLHRLSGSKRRFVIKYAGSHGALMAGGKGVYQLDGKRHGDDGAEGLIARAIEDWKKGEGAWLIQERVRRTFPVRFLESNGEIERLDGAYARFMPYFTQNGDSGYELASINALFARSWKVHGNPNSIHCPVQLEDPKGNGAPSNGKHR